MINGDDILFTYPPNEKFAISITKYDASRLNPEEYLNDTVIEFYLRYLETQAPDNYDNNFRFSSFFYSNFIRNDNSGSRAKDMDQGYQRVKSYTKKEVFESEYVIIPINEHQHWYLAIIHNAKYLLEKPLDTDIHSNLNELIDIQAERNWSFNSPGSETVTDIQSVTRMRSSHYGQRSDANDYLDLSHSKEDWEHVATPTVPREALEVIDVDEGEVRTKVSGKTRGQQNQNSCRIFILDSLSSSRLTTIRNIKIYLKHEAKEKHNIDIVETDISGIIAKVPKQPNTWDCGVHLLENYEFFFKNRADSLQCFLVLI